MTDKIKKEDLSKTKQRNLLQGFILDSVRSKIKDFAEAKKSKLDKLASQISELIVDAIPEIENTSEMEEFSAIIKDSYELFFGLGYNVQDLKSAFWHNGLPFELRSTPEGKQFLKDYENGEFYDDENKFSKGIMSKKELELYHLYRSFQNKNKSQGKAGNGPINEFITNLFYNAIPEKYEKRVSAEESLKKSKERAIESAKEYNTLVEEGYEEIFFDQLNLPLRSSLTNEETKNGIKNKKKGYNSLDFFGKLQVLKEIKESIITDYNKMVKLGLETKMIANLEKSVENESVNKDAILRQLEEFPKLSIINKYKKLKSYSNIRWGKTEADLDKRLAAFEAKKYKNTKAKKVTPKITSEAALLRIRQKEEEARLTEQAINLIL